MNTIDYLLKLRLNNKLKAIKKMIDKPERWFKLNELVSAGCMYDKMKKMLNVWEKAGMISSKKSEWKTGKNKRNISQGRVYQINLKSPLVKILLIEVERRIKK